MSTDAAEDRDQGREERLRGWAIRFGGYDDRVKWEHLGEEQQHALEGHEIPLLRAHEDAARADRDMDWWRELVLCDAVAPTPEAAKAWLLAICQDAREVDVARAEAAEAGKREAEETWRHESVKQHRRADEAEERARRAEKRAETLMAASCGNDKDKNCKEYVGLCWEHRVWTLEAEVAQLKDERDSFQEAMGACATEARVAIEDRIQTQRRVEELEKALRAARVAMYKANRMLEAIDDAGDVWDVLADQFEGVPAEEYQQIEALAQGTRCPICNLTDEEIHEIRQPNGRHRSCESHVAHGGRSREGTEPQPGDA